MCLKKNDRGAVLLTMVKLCRLAETNSHKVIGIVTVVGGVFVFAGKNVCGFVLFSHSYLSNVQKKKCT